jgi:hypothetical protein
VYPLHASAAGRRAVAAAMMPANFIVSKRSKQRKWS